jgi:hypothetical protein
MIARRKGGFRGENPKHYRNDLFLQLFFRVLPATVIEICRVRGCEINSRIGSCSADAVISVWLSRGGRLSPIAVGSPHHLQRLGKPKLYLMEVF